TGVETAEGPPSRGPRHPIKASPGTQCSGTARRSAAAWRHATMGDPMWAQLRKVLRTGVVTEPAAPGESGALPMIGASLAADGGLFAGSYAVVGGVSLVVPVDLHVAGCPPSPRALLEAFLALLAALRADPARLPR